MRSGGADRRRCGAASVSAFIWATSAPSENTPMTPRKRRLLWLAGGAAPLLTAAVVAIVACNNSGSTGNNAPVDEGPPLPLVPPGPAMFEDKTKDSGVDFMYRNGEESRHMAILESLGGGAALIDFDGDGLLDIFIPGGGHFDMD